MMFCSKLLVRNPSLVFSNTRFLSTFQKTRLSKALQQEIITCLGALEIQKPRGQVDFKVVRNQFLKLAQQHHPDTIENEDDLEQSQEKFIEVKTAYDRLVHINEQQNYAIFLDLEAEKKVQKDNKEITQKLSEIRRKIKQKKQEEAKEQQKAGKIAEREYWAKQKEQDEVRAHQMRAAQQRARKDWIDLKTILRQVEKDVAAEELAAVKWVRTKQVERRDFRKYDRDERIKEFDSHAANAAEDMKRQNIVRTNEGPSPQQRVDEANKEKAQRK